MDREVAPAGFIAVLAAIFGGLALLLAATGIYGVLNYQVSRRMPEMGTRMALGATTGDVLTLVLREGLTLAAAGVLLGLVAARAAAQGIGPCSLAFAGDPVSFGLRCCCFLGGVLVAGVPRGAPPPRIPPIDTRKIPCD